MKLELAQQATRAVLASKLLKSSNLSDDQLLSCFRNGAVWLGDPGKPRRLYEPDHIVKPNQTLYLNCNDSTLSPCPFEARLIKDFESFSIWFKPSGMLSQGSKWGDHWTVQRWVHHHHFPDRDCLITHRLDRFTSGLIIIAHDQQINRRLHQAFEQRKVRKTYRAVVKGQLPLGLKDELVGNVEGKSAFTSIEVIDNDQQQDISLLQITPLTGRKHQIRIHLAEYGYPVLNDRHYGSPPFSGDLQLQACGLALQSPVDFEPLSIKLEQDLILVLPKYTNAPPGKS